MRDSYTEAHLRFLRKAYASMKVQDLTIAFNKQFGTSKSEVAIKSALSNNKIVCGRKGSERLINHERLYTPEQRQFIFDHHVGRSRAEMADLFNRRFGANMTVVQVKAFVANRHLNSGLTGRFEKGQIPPNKGTKGLTGANRTSFKKGDIPSNTRQLYAERISKDGYVEIKVPEKNPYTGCPTRFRLKHIWIWEQSHGKIPVSHAILFKDGNPLHCALDNLMLIKRSELLRLNKHGYKEAPAEIKPTVLALAKLEVKTFEAIKGEGISV
jgi:hypothetical protein